VPPAEKAFSKRYDFCHEGLPWSGQRQSTFHRSSSSAKSIRPWRFIAISLGSRHDFRSPTSIHSSRLSVGEASSYSSSRTRTRRHCRTRGDILQCDGMLTSTLQILIPSPRCFRFLTANGPHSSRGVFSGCSWRSNFSILSVSCPRNCLASDFSWNPTTMSSANRTTMTSPWRVLDPQIKHVVARAQLTLSGVSYNAGVVKYFFSTLLHPLRDERHFALVEISAIPTKARS
jgi:hypothetical protein